MRHPVVLRASFVLLLLTSPAGMAGVAAQTSTWTGAGGINWNNAPNWSPSGVPTASSSVVFPAGVFITTPLLTAGGAAASLLFDAGATSYTLSSNAGVSLTGVNAITVSPTTTAAQMIDLANIATGSLLFPVGQNLTVTNNAAPTAVAAPTLVIGPNTVIGTPGSGGVVFGGTGTTTFSGSFSTLGPPNNAVLGGLTKHGPGALTLSGNGGNLSGGLTLSGGTLRLNYATNTASKLGSGGLTSAGGDFVMVPHATTAVTQNFASTALTAGHTSVSSFGSGAPMTLSLGSIARSAGATLDVPSSGVAVVSFAGTTNGLLGAGKAFATVNGQSWASEDSGSFVIPLTGESMIGPGINHDQGFSQTFVTDVTNSLRFTGNNATLTMNGTLTLQSGGILAPAGVTGSVITGGTLTTTGGGEFLVHAYGPLTINSALISSAGLTKTGPEMLTLGGTNGSLHGPVTISRGGLRVTNSSAIGFVNSLSFTDNAARGDGAQTFAIDPGNGVFTSVNRDIRFSASANAPGVFPNVISTASSNARIEIGGTISSAPGAVTPIRFDGPADKSSRFEPIGFHTFVGPVELRNGTLGISSNVNLGDPSNVLRLNVNDATAGGLEFMRGGSGIDLARPVVMVSPGRVLSHDAEVHTISGPLSGNFQMNKAGTGTLVLTGANTLNSVLIDAGTLRVNAAAVGTTADFFVGGGTTLALSQTATLSKFLLLGSADGFGTGTVDVPAGVGLTVSGTVINRTFFNPAGALLKTGTGTLTLTNSLNDYGGGTTVRAGELRAASDGALGAGPVSVEPAGQLTFTGSTTTSRNYTLDGGRLGTVAGQTLTFANSTVAGGYLFGAGAFATQAGTANTFIGNTSFALSSFTLSGLDDLIAYTNGGLITKAPGQSAALTQFTNAASGRIVLNGGAFAAEFVSHGLITVNAGGTINNLASPLILGGGSRTTVNAGGTINLSGGTTLELNGALLVNNGIITGATNVNFGSVAKGVGAYGAVNIGDGGTFAPGTSPGIVTAASVDFDDAAFASGGPTLAIEIGGTTPGVQYDRLNVTGQLSLGGTLEVALINGFNPAAGNTFDLLNWGSLTGQFTSINLPPLAGLAWNTSQLYTTGVLSVVAPGFQAADFDEDGDVDGADLTRWRSNFGTGTTHMQGDADGDGDADGADFLTWQRQVGLPPPAAGATVAIPEPASFVLLGVALTFLGTVKRRPPNGWKSIAILFACG